MITWIIIEYELLVFDKNTWNNTTNLIICIWLEYLKQHN